MYRHLELRAKLITVACIIAECTVQQLKASPQDRPWRDDSLCLRVLGHEGLETIHCHIKVVKKEIVIASELITEMMKLHEFLQVGTALYVHCRLQGPEAFRRTVLLRQALDDKTPNFCVVDDSGSLLVTGSFNLRIGTCQLGFEVLYLRGLGLDVDVSNTEDLLPGHDCRLLHTHETDDVISTAGALIGSGKNSFLQCSQFQVSSCNPGPFRSGRQKQTTKQTKSLSRAIAAQGHLNCTNNAAR
mmetsp:Transcript_9277/g.22111  ORF Transcript_9277/g.22111 Transcript_9277/m.22111 type:complete len:244 (+) Transcript_9277:1401-2132(+)